MWLAVYYKEGYGYVGVGQGYYGTSFGSGEPAATLEDAQAEIEQRWEEEQRQPVLVDDADD